MAALNERPKLSFDARDVSPTSEWQGYIAAYNFQGASSYSSTLHNPAISLSTARSGGLPWSLQPFVVGGEMGKQQI